MKKEGIHIFTVAVGNANVGNVGALASKPLSKYFYNVTYEDMLPLILHKMIWNMCVRDPAHDGNFPTLVQSEAAVPRLKQAEPRRSVAVQAPSVPTVSAVQANSGA